MCGPLSAVRHAPRIMPVFIIIIIITIDIHSLTQQQSVKLDLNHTEWRFGGPNLVLFFK